MSDEEVLPETVGRGQGITFDMYCTQKGIPQRRRAGMKVYAKSRQKSDRMTIEEWDALFVAY